MTIRYLEIFLEVCRNENTISRAAKKLYISQPAVSAAIAEIEKEYEIRLFERLSGRLYLTEAGRDLERYAKSILDDYRKMNRHMADLKKQGTLRVGASLTVGNYMLPEILEQLRENDSNATVQVRVEGSRKLLACLQNNEIDIALIETSVSGPNLIVDVFRKDTLEMIVPPSAPYMPDMAVKIEDLEKYTFLMRDRESGTREVFEAEMERHHLFIKPSWESSVPSALIEAVSNGHGVSVVPRCEAEHAAQQGKVFTARIEGASFEQNFYVVHHKDKNLTRELESFIELVMRYGAAGGGDAFF